MKLFEIIMLACFGMSWPFSIYRSWTARTTGGKSPIFLVFVIIGYIAGVVHKLINSLDFVIVLYALNAVMVSVDLCIYLRNRKLELGSGA